MASLTLALPPELRIIIYKHVIREHSALTKASRIEWKRTRRPFGELPPLSAASHQTRLEMLPMILGDMKLCVHTVRGRDDWDALAIKQTDLDITPYNHKKLRALNKYEQTSESSACVEVTTWIGFLEIDKKALIQNLTSMVFSVHLRNFCIVEVFISFEKGTTTPEATTLPPPPRPSEVKVQLRDSLRQQWALQNPGAATPTLEPTEKQQLRVNLLKAKVEANIRLSEEWNEELISGITKLLRGPGVHREPIHPVALWYITPPYIMPVTRKMVLQSLTTVAAKQPVDTTTVEKPVSTTTVEQPVSTMTVKHKAKKSAWWKCW